MAGKSHWLETQILNHLMRTTALAQFGTVYVALFTAAPTDDFTSGVPTGTEVSGGSYARASVGTLDADWSLTAGSGATAGKVANAAAINFATPTAGWGTVTHFAVMDALTGGNLLFWAPLTTSKTINSGDTVSFAIGALTYSED